MWLTAAAVSTPASDFTRWTRSAKKVARNAGSLYFAPGSTRFMVRTFSAENPGFVFKRDRNERANSPAPTSKTNDRATSKTTKELRNPVSYTHLRAHETPEHLV